VTRARGVAQRQGAQGLVEFALVVPLFLLLVFALITFSRLLFTYISLANGVREMARAGAVSWNWTAAPMIAAFNNTVIIAGPQTVSDTITIRTGDAACARLLDAGSACSTSTLYRCTLPLSAGTCTPALARPPQDGFVEVTVEYTFQFNPLFENRLQGITNVSFMRPTATISTTARAYVE
jgi:Flp pilus assembly protein TadG